MDLYDLEGIREDVGETLRFLALFLIDLLFVFILFRYMQIILYSIQGHLVCSGNINRKKFVFCGLGHDFCRFDNFL